MWMPPSIRTAHIHDLTSAPCLLRPAIFINHPPTVSHFSLTSCLHWFSPCFFLFFMTDLDLACPLTHFHSGCTLSTLPSLALEFLFSLNICGLCQANSSPWVPFLFAFSIHMQWSLGWRKSWKCIDLDCPRSLLCSFCLALAVALLLFYVSFLLLQTFSPPLKASVLFLYPSI